MLQFSITVSMIKEKIAWPLEGTVNKLLVTGTHYFFSTVKKKIRTQKGSWISLTCIWMQG